MGESREILRWGENVPGLFDKREREKTRIASAKRKEAVTMSVW